jgi:hypothetical protein
LEREFEMFENHKTKKNLTNPFALNKNNSQRTSQYDGYDHGRHSWDDPPEDLDRSPHTTLGHLGTFSAMKPFAEVGLHATKT